MSTFRYICIGIGSLVSGVAALLGGLYGLWGGLYGVGYLITTVANHFKLDPAQLTSSWFEGILEPGYVVVALSCIMSVGLLSALLALFLLGMTALGKVVAERIDRLRLG
jgi:hypothetical protein